MLAGQRVGGVVGPCLIAPRKVRMQGAMTTTVETIRFLSLYSDTSPLVNGCLCQRISPEEEEEEEEGYASVNSACTRDFLGSQKSSESQLPSHAGQLRQNGRLARAFKAPYRRALLGALTQCTLY